MLTLRVRLGRGCVEVHRGTVLETLLLFFIGYYGFAQDSGSKSIFKKGPTVQFDRIPIQSHAYLKQPIHQFFQRCIRATKDMNKQGWQA